MATVGVAAALLSACGGGSATSASDAVSPDDKGAADGTASPSASASADASAGPSAGPSVSASRSASATPSAAPSAARASARATSSGSGSGSSGRSGAAASSTTRTTAPAPASTPHFPVPVTVGDATQVITVRASGSYATVTAWAKGAGGWKSVLSTTAARVGSHGVVDGSTRKQGTYTTPSGTYTITEGFGVDAGGTAMPYTRLDDTLWWDEDPDSKYYNSMHTAAGADFPLTESGADGSEHLIDHQPQYDKALVINFNRWPAVPGRGAGIFLHINGSGATAGCVSVPASTMDQIMGWIKPGAHPRIAIG
ncbi:L,D-transpeptidase family protein [Streptomyces beihaiensis]|uniref:L,D-transpeptidase family protein n=1 Tax=Streptomyces beihaiensis TaxID=2984495 RepID=A0ABT3TPT1_9ACTN|nr:L,D-transpeptidase family protein [Streptomyces beihaiensis]MCX3058997.1 L,D-transpeptidase family protein [Streptomyces beihaiensis]